MENAGLEHGLFRKLVEAFEPILNAGLEHSRAEDPDLHAQIMEAIGEKRARPRVDVTWDEIYVVVNLSAIGITKEEKEVSVPIFSYRLHRQTPPKVH